MNVVWITSSVPHPQGAGGCAHEFELIRALAPRHDIHVVSCHANAELGPEPLRSTGARFTEVPYLARPYPTSKLGVGRGLVRADPTLAIWLARDRIPQLAEAVARVTSANPPDVVQVTHGELAHLLDRVPDPTGLLLFDAMTRALETRRAVEPLPRRRLQLRVESARTRRFEQRWYRRATGLASVSSVDARWLEALLDRPVDVLENPIGDEFFAIPDRPRSSNLVTFVGALNHQPNADAIEWLAAEIWPLVRARRPEARLVVVGRGDRTPLVDHLRQLVEGVDGRLDADVPDIRPYYWEAAAVVAPLRHGSGLRNKVIHAMACGAPVVATPAAVEGIPAATAGFVRTAGSAAEVADAVIDVLADPTIARTDADAAIASLDVLRAGAIAARHERWWEDLVARQAGSSTRVP